MKRISFSTPTYMLENTKGVIFGYITGKVSLPDYKTDVYIDFLEKNQLKDEGLSIDGFYSMNFDLSELEMIQEGVESIHNQIKTLINLAKKNQLKDEFYKYE